MPEFLDNILAPLRRNVAPTKTIGVGGTAIYGGYVQENEREKSLTGTERYRTYSDILANAAIAAASVRYFLNLVAKSGWKVEPAEVDPGLRGRAEEVAELIDSMLYDMTTPWSRVVRRAAMFKFHGYSIQEWTAKRRDDGLIGMIDVEARPQATIEQWDVDTTGTVMGVVQRSPQNGETIYLPRRKLVYAVDDALKDSPEGLGIFHHLAEPWNRLKQYQLLEAYGYETDLRGVPVARGPLGLLQQQVEQEAMTADKRDEIIKPLKDFIENHVRDPKMGLLLDSLTYQTTDERQSPSNVYQWDVDLMRGDASTSSEAVAKAIERLNREMARIMGTEFLLLGGDGKGSLALARNKTDQFALTVDSTLTELGEAFEADLLDPILRMNGWDSGLMPTLKPDSTAFRDVEQITSALAQMAQAGATLAPDDPVINEVRDLLGLSRQEVITLLEDASLTVPTATGAAPEPGTNGKEQELPDTREEEAEEEATT